MPYKLEMRRTGQVSTFWINNIMVVSQNYGHLNRVPYHKDYSILGSILGYPNLGKLPYDY